MEGGVVMTVNVFECDACGETKPYEDGQHFTDYTGWPDEQPVEVWICADCLVGAEDREVAREEERRERYYWDK